jgi:hypothetical protein
MLKSKKHVFWEALLITVVIFLAGLFLGMLIEANNSTKISDLYTQSEISLTDASAAARLTEELELDCEAIRKANIDLADRVYEEAKLLELYEDSGKLTNSMELLHKKYDLLRTLLWSSNQKSLERCENYNLLVYLYQYGSEETEVKATQNVWSKILLEVRKENENILLLPIAANQNLTSLDLLVEEHQIQRLPALVINNNQVLYNIENPEVVRNFLG